MTMFWDRFSAVTITDSMTKKSTDSHDQKLLFWAKTQTFHWQPQVNISIFFFFVAAVFACTSFVFVGWWFCHFQWCRLILYPNEDLCLYIYIWIWNFRDDFWTSLIKRWVSQWSSLGVGLFSFSILFHSMYSSI